MTPIDIRPADLATVQRILREHVPALEVRAFGSRVTWTARQTSDLDLALMTDTPLSIDRTAALRAAFTDSDLPFRVDVVDWASTPEAFRQRILAEQLVLRSRAVAPTTHDGAFGTTDPLLTETWDTMPFTDAFQINPDVPIKRGSPTPFVDMAAIDPNARSVHSAETRKFGGGGSRFRNGDTLMARITPCLENGKIARYRADSETGIGHGSTEFIVVRGRPEVTDTEYAFYVTRSDHIRDYAIGQMTGTSGRQRVPTESLAHLDVAVPSLLEQRAIAHVLGTLDDKIELNRRMNATLEAMARALFRSWFVDFDPVRAKMAGRDTGLPQEIADLFPDRLVESELGEIPEGWEPTRLDSVATVTKGRSYRRRELVASDTALVTLKSFARGGGYRAEGLKPFGGVYKSEQVVEPGEVIVACTDVTQAAEVVGRSAVVGETSMFRRLVASLDVLIVRPKSSAPGRAFVYYVTGTEGFVAHTLARTTGTTVLHLSKDAVASFRFALPLRPLMERFGHSADSLRGLIQTNASATGLLAHLRDTLLPKLVSGALRVDGLEPATGSVDNRARVGTHAP